LHAFCEDARSFVNASVSQWVGTLIAHGIRRVRQKTNKRLCKRVAAQFVNEMIDNAKKIAEDKRAAIQPVYLCVYTTYNSVWNIVSTMTMMIANLLTRTAGKPRKKRNGDSECHAEEGGCETHWREEIRLCIHQIRLPERYVCA
jgi:hypothetical protein